MNDFKSRLQEVIHMLKVEHQEFAKAGGISKATLSGYFNSHRLPKVDTLAKWVAEYGVNANWLLCGQGTAFGVSEAGVSDPREYLLKVALSELKSHGASDKEIREAILLVLADREKRS